MKHPLRLFLAALLLVACTGCQLLALPFQLVGGVLGILGKLLPLAGTLAPLLIYEPIEPQAPGMEPAPVIQPVIQPAGEASTDVYLATLDDRIEEARGIEVDAPPPPLLAERLPADEPGRRLAGVILVPAGILDRPERMAPLLERLTGAGYEVEIGDLVDGRELATNDLLPQAKFLAETEARDVDVIAAAPLAHLTTAGARSDVLAEMPAALEEALGELLPRALEAAEEE